MIKILTDLYHHPNEQKGGKGVVAVTNIDFFSRKNSRPTGSVFCQRQQQSLVYHVLKLHGPFRDLEDARDEKTWARTHNSAKR